MSASGFAACGVELMVLWWGAPCNVRRCPPSDFRAFLNRGLSADGAAWVQPAHRRFLMPGYALSPRFRASMRDALTRAGLSETVDERVWRRRWTVHVQQIGTGEHAAHYLSRYVYRVALTNQRLVRFADGHVTFRYTHARSHEQRVLTLPVDAFLSRFLEHVLPRGFTKIRWYGLLSPGRRPALERARELLTTHPTALAARPTSVASPTRATPSVLGEGSPPSAIQHCRVCVRGHCTLVTAYRPSRGPP